MAKHEKSPADAPPSPSHDDTPSPDASMPPRLMTARQLSQFLQMSRTTIYRMCDQGLIPYYQVGKRKRFDPIAVLSAIDRHR